MKKFLFFLFAAFLCVGINAQAQTQTEPVEDVEEEYEVVSLDEDIVCEFRFVYDVKYTSAFDPEKGMWKVRLEEVFEKPDPFRRHVEIYWLKLDEGCDPGPMVLDKFKISGHRFAIYLMKKIPKK